MSADIGSARARMAILEPTLAEILERDPVELRITWLEIRALPEPDASARA